MGQMFGRRRNLTIVCILVVISLLFLGIFAPNPLQPPQPKLRRRVSQTKLRNPLMFRAPKQAPPPTSFAESVLYVITLPGDRVWDQVPILTQTLLSDYPHTLLTSDSGLVIGQTVIHDVLADLDRQTLEKDSELSFYRIARLGKDEGWGWPIQEYLQDRKDYVMPLVRQETLKLALKKLSPEQQWVVLASENSYLSPHLMGNSSLTNTLFTSGDDRPENDMLLLSREAFENYAATNQLPELKVVPAHNLSSTLVTKSQWCEPLLAFTGLQRWEIQTLFGRDMVRSEVVNHNLGSGFYRDFVLPFVLEEKPDWAIYPTSSKTISDKTITKERCKELCKENHECLAWQWTNATDCQLETHGVKRGIAISPYYNRVNETHPSMISGWMVDRIRGIRCNAKCDTLKIDEDGNIPEDDWTAEGFIHDIRAHRKDIGTPVRDAIKAYNDYLDSHPGKK